MSELLLTISTATRVGSVAVTRGEMLLGEVTIDPPGTQSDILLPAIDRLLADLGLSLGEVDGFAVVQGPGAFTGLRVGVSTVKGLAVATGKPIVGVSSLHALSLQVPDVSLPVYALIDARKGEVYAGRFSWAAGLPQLIGKERVIDPSVILEEISEEALFVGDGSAAYRTLIVRKLGEKARFAPWSANTLKAGSAAMLAVHKYRNGEMSQPESLNPIYIRASEAEINMCKTAVDSGIEG